MEELRNAAKLISQGKLDEAHAIVQDLETPEAAYWHGILHRAEGDYWNSKYWFRRAAHLPQRLGQDPNALSDAVERARGDINPELSAQLKAEFDALAAHCAES